jgi:peptidoglycan-N-acetylglucosamine deacetylase
MKFQVLGLAIWLFSLNTAGASECAYNSDKSMLSRVVAIDSANGAIYDKRSTVSAASDTPLPLALNEKEIVLSFDQGPHTTNTEYILYTLDRYCAKAVFFFTGSTALANPGAVREAAQRGHTIAAGPWTASAGFANITIENAKLEIEKGLTAVAKAADAPIAPFFRVPSAATPDVLIYLKERGVSLWSYDIASGDNEPGVTAGQLASRALVKIRETGKGIIQFHDTSKVTVDALDDILSVARHDGFKVVQIVPASSFIPKEEYVAGLPKPLLKTSQSSTAPSQSMVAAAKRRVRLRADEGSPARRPARVRQPEG